MIPIANALIGETTDNEIYLQQEVGVSEGNVSDENIYGTINDRNIFISNTTSYNVYISHNYGMKRETSVVGSYMADYLKYEKEKMKEPIPKEKINALLFVMFMSVIFYIFIFRKKWIS